MKKLTQQASAPEINEWVRAALADELKGILEMDWLNICKVDRIARALHLLRGQCRIPSQGPAYEATYAGLVALHCVPFATLSTFTLSGLPRALFTFFELDNTSGRVILGEKHWADTRRSLEGHVAASLRSREYACVVLRNGHCRRVGERRKQATELAPLAMRNTPLVPLTTEKVKGTRKRAKKIPASQSEDDVFAPRSAPSHPPWDKLSSTVTPEDCRNASPGHVPTDTVPAPLNNIDPVAENSASTPRTFRSSCGADLPPVELREIDNLDDDPDDT